MSDVGVVLLCVASIGCGRLGFDAGGADGDVGAGDASRGSLSCAELPPACGSTGSEPCCSSLMVPGATFFRSFDVGTDNAYVDSTHPATLSAFRLDKFEVTVARFRAFVNAGMGTQQNPPASGAGGRTLNGSANQGGWDSAWNALLPADTAALRADLKCNVTLLTWTDVAGSNEALPINCVSWYQAMAFCIWDGGFLPTEAEWNYVAAGGGEQRAYPWSNPATSVAIDCAHANHFTGTAECVAGGAARVGMSTSGAGKWGHEDLAGNVLEWTLDFQAAYVDPCNDCAQLQSGTLRIVRGGSFGQAPGPLRTAYRNGGLAEQGAAADGIRCARAP